jgi:hypothetical protein
VPGFGTGLGVSGAGSLNVVNESTQYVRMHVVNYEPLYVALNHAVSLYRPAEHGSIDAARDYLSAAVGRHYRDAGLDDRHLSGDVDYAEMVRWEFDNRD